MAAGWYPLALSAMIPAGTSAGAVVEGAEIVVWRDTSGVAHTWEDRCPHRGMKLSFGFVRGDHIACLYHGWEYDTAGQCRYIPAHPKLEVPKTICTRTFPVAEAGGMIWVRPQGEAESAPELAEAVGVRSLYLDVSLQAALAALPALGATGPVNVEDAVARFDSDLGPVAIGLQGIAPSRCALHVTIIGTPATAALVTLAGRCAALRRAVEGADRAAGVAA